ncbi:MAG: hypothetical protein WDA12_05035 [Bacilli bacterium]
MADIRKIVSLIFNRASGDEVESQIAESIGNAGKEGSKHLEEEVGKKGGKKTAEEFGKAFTKHFQRIVAPILSLFTAAGLTRFFKQSIEIAAQAEQNALRLRGVWEANAGAVGLTFKEIQSFLKEVKDTTLFSGSDLSLAASQLLSYKSISEDTFKRTISLATDMASVFGGLANSTMAVAKALDDPIRGMDMLRKQGFTFEAQVYKQIQALTEQNRLLEAQDLILAVLEDEISGVAKMMKTGWAGAIDSLNKAYGSLKKSIGDYLMDSSNGISIMDRVTRSIIWMNNNLDELIAIVKNLIIAIGVVGVAGAIGKVTIAVRAADSAFKAWRLTLIGFNALIGPKGWFVLGVAAVTAALTKVSEATREAKQEQQEYLRSLEDMNLDEIKVQITELGKQMVDLGLQLMDPNLSSGQKSAIERNIKLVRDAWERAIEIRDQLLNESERPSPFDFDPELTLEEKELLREKAEKMWTHFFQAIGQPGRRNVRISVPLELTEFDIEAPVMLYRKELRRLGFELDEVARQELIEKDRQKQIFDALGGTLETVQVSAFTRQALDERKEFYEEELRVLDIVQAHSENAANAISYAFHNAFMLMHEDAVTVGNFVEGVMRSLGSSGLAAISDWAHGKVKANMAEAIEQGARALGFYATGNVPAASAAASSAAQHLAAAAAWGVLAGGSGALSGIVMERPSGGSPSSSRDSGIGMAERSDPVGPEVHVYFDPLDPNSMRVQEFHRETRRQVNELWGDSNAVIRWHPYPSRAG